MVLHTLLLGVTADTELQKIQPFCQRIASSIVVTNTMQQTFLQLQTIAPEVCILDMDLPDYTQNGFLAALQHVQPNHTQLLLLHDTFMAEQVCVFQKAGVDDFVKKPLTADVVYSVVAKRYPLDFRINPRYAVTLPVTAANGDLIGETLDLSRSGMRLRLATPLRVGDSLLLNILLPDSNPLPIRVRCSVLEIMSEPFKTYPAGAWQARLQIENLRGTQSERLLNYLASL